MSIIPGIDDRRAGPHGHEQRVRRVAEALPRLAFERGDVLVDLVVEAGRHLAAVGDIRATGVRRDREPGGNRDPERRHLREADALAPEKLPAASGVLVEVVDVAGLHATIIAHAARPHLGEVSSPPVTIPHLSRMMRSG